LRNHTKNQFLTTNLFPSPFLPVTDMAKLSSKLDFISWDNYPVWGSQSEPFPHQWIATTLQYSRGLKDKNFTVMEQFSGMQGHDTLGYLPPPGQIGLWVVQALAHGADKIYFFRYRTARFGQEQLCYGILDHDKELTGKYRELQETIRKIKVYSEDFSDEEFPSEVAVLHDIDNSRNFKHQPLSEGLKFSPVPYAQLGYDVEIATWFSGLSALNVNATLIPSATENISRYKVLVLPLYSMVDDDFFKKVEEFVRNGGTLVLGYRSGVKDKNNWMYDEIPPGPFREMAGIAVRRFESVGNDKIKVKLGLFPGYCSKFCELIEPITAKVIGRYNDPKKFYRGYPVATVNKYHAGKVYYIGSSLSPELFVILYRKILRKSGIKFSFLGRYAERVFRKGKDNDYDIIMNHSNSVKWIGFRRFKPFEYSPYALFDMPYVLPGSSIYSPDFESVYLYIQTLSEYIPEAIVGCHVLPESRPKRDVGKLSLVKEIRIGEFRYLFILKFELAHLGGVKKEDVVKNASQMFNASVRTDRIYFSVRIIPVSSVDRDRNQIVDFTVQSYDASIFQMSTQNQSDSSRRIVSEIFDEIDFTFANNSIRDQLRITPENWSPGKVYEPVAIEYLTVALRFLSLSQKEILADFESFHEIIGYIFAGEKFPPEKAVENYVKWLKSFRSERTISPSGNMLWRIQKLREP
ncbi:MAG: beta-galactosidase, partial [Leptospira sp.]|nr:beta-galactosidase [Leptospira sp.]